MKPKEKHTETSKTLHSKEKLIESHEKIATHLEEAAKKHHESVKHYEEGNYDKAAQCIVDSHKHTQLAAEAQTEMLKHPIFTS